MARSRRCAPRWAPGHERAERANHQLSATRMRHAAERGDSMSGIFGALGIAGTGLTVHRKWLDAAGDNIANINNVTSTSNDAFQARYVVARAVDYGSGTEGVQVGGAVLSGKTGGRLVYEPSHPLADE